MAKRKRALHNGEVEVRITGPGCRWGDRLYRPGETATVPAEIAREWKQSQRAVITTAEVKEDDIGQDS